MAGQDIGMDIKQLRLKLKPQKDELFFKSIVTATNDALIERLERIITDLTKLTSDGEALFLNTNDQTFVAIVIINEKIYDNEMRMYTKELKKPFYIAVTGYPVSFRKNPILLNCCFTSIIGYFSSQNTKLNS